MSTYTIEDAADYLKMSKRCIYDKISRGLLPRRKSGKRLVFYEYELHDFLDSQTQQHPHRKVRQCRSTKEKIARISTHQSQSMDKRLEKALKPKTSVKQNATKVG